MTPIVAVALALAWMGATGCRRAPGPRDPDPWQTVNRPFFSFNETLDRYVMTPIVRGYEWMTSEWVRKRVSNFFSNLGEIYTIPNQILQGKPLQAGSDIGRFVTNTTVGGLGLFDPATGWRMEKHEEDFGQTLAVWRLPQGPYLVLPLFGPSTVRDVPGLIVNSIINGLLMNPFDPILTMSLGLLGRVDDRTQAQSGLDEVEESAIDKYVFIREAYLQRRLFLIHDGSLPVSGVDDLFDDIDFEEGSAPVEAGPDGITEGAEQAGGESQEDEDPDQGPEPDQD
jgi:phospholipid-binding lipoprotein MlaA